MNRQNIQNDSGQMQGQPVQNIPTKPRGKLVHWVGAVVSFGLLGGMIYWGLQLVERDPSQVPVIKAMEGPARTVPDTPGGEVAENLGLAVNKIQTGTGAADGPDRVVLAPEEQTLTEAEILEPAVETPEVAIVEPELIEETPEIEIVEPVNAEVVAAVEKAEREAAEALEEAIRLATLGATPAVTEPEPEVTEPVVATTVVPKLRPKDLVVAAKTENTVSNPALKNKITDVPVGTKLVQLGAYDSEAQAFEEWTRLFNKHRDLLGPKNVLVQSAVSGGRQFFRLRATGFENADDSKSFCTALNARGTACLALTVR